MTPTGLDQQLRSHYVVLEAEIQEIDADLTTAENFTLKYGRDCFSDGARHLKMLKKQKMDQMGRIQAQLAEIQSSMDRSQSLLTGINAEIQGGPVSLQQSMYEPRNTPPPSYGRMPEPEPAVSVLSASPILSHSVRPASTRSPGPGSRDASAIYSPILAYSNRMR
ncbi:hypothetical protein J8273_5056 [Carpediemonas membranifera]|uniref:Uncharacterized protein n=1 Tax=Carpediemonas membranifera TaxID=201153 RepID=A0A8J6B5P0_9EUKA|nr:hypothetical protein J8273_5056 [Carpediemonas membranifera]|eukprot:KAG9393569.1 hypothetical protein J8273_5056 [Carpediemonas membranifera]